MQLSIKIWATFFNRNEEDDPKIYMETQGTQDGQKNIEKNMLEDSHFLIWKPSAKL